MLKDITLGQYFPGDTPAHKLDPRTKIILVILYIVALFQAKNLLTYALMAVTFVLCARVSKVGARALLKGLKPVVIIVLFTGFLNLFFTPGETLFELGFLRLTDQGVYNALRMVVRIMLLIMGTFLLTYTTSPIALRFIPTLIEETDKIMSAQKARGADFESGNLIQKAKALVPVLVPLFVSSFRRADELAVAMECRCYHGGEGRTRLHVLHFASRDYLALVLGAVITAAVIILARLGF